MSKAQAIISSVTLEGLSQSDAAEPKKRPKSFYIRFEADLPNETWQSDFTHYRLDNGNDTEILVWLDDHSRYALSVTAQHRVTGNLVASTFNQCAAGQGFPASVLTDNGQAARRAAVSLRRAGRMHHIGIGRAHKHVAVIGLIDDLNIRVIATNTGELLRPSRWTATPATNHATESKKPPEPQVQEVPMS